MIIIAFAPRSSKFLPNLICNHFKHCAVIERAGRDFILYQFISRGHIEKICIKMRDIKLLGAHGWHFVYVPIDIKPDFNPNDAWTCVDMAKRALGIKSIMIQTPDGLAKKLSE